jgi:hypothetical protein
LIKGHIYIVCSLAGPQCIDIDGSGRAWQNWRFRPLIEGKTEISFTTGADPDSERWDNRVKVPSLDRMNSRA